MTSATAQPATMSRRATGGSDLWCTPDVVLERVRRVGPIGLDPCSSRDNPTGATSHVWAPDGDGLELDWLDHMNAVGDGLVYVNPPYSEAAAWAEKVASESGRGLDIVSLVAARPDSRWFFRLVWDSAAAVCFWKGRLRFVGAPSSAPFPSAVVYHGARPWAFEAAFHDAGRVIRL